MDNKNLKLRLKSFKLFLKRLKRVNSKEEYFDTGLRAVKKQNLHEVSFYG
jgi:hypothetical protein